MWLLMPSMRAAFGVSTAKAVYSPTTNGPAHRHRSGCGIQLELLTGPLTGIYDPAGMGAILFAVLAVAAQLDRNYIREKTLEGQQAAAAKGNHGGRPKVIDDDMLLFARALKDQGTPIPQIATKLTIATGKNTGHHPSVASLYRALATQG